ncbi:MAG: hypothetical protein KDD43_06220 [Bdellovibrionales bacterium]|nr:hypothetical protein [Bdellovibrionales bacterium]
MENSENGKRWVCNAGINAVSILPDGSMNVCWDRKPENLGNIYEGGFKLRNQLINCDLVHCACPLWAFEKDLHAIAKGEPATRPVPYDVFAHWHITYECQMMCEYCIVTGPDRATDTKDKKTRSKPVPIDSMLKVVDESGLKFCFSLMGGEPFLVPNVIEVCERLAERGHMIGANTNLCAVPHEFWKSVPHEQISNIHISLHIHPMQRKGITQQFIDGYKAMVDSGFDRFYITAVAHPSLFERLDEYRELFGKHGINFKLIPMLEGGGASKGKVYPESYTQEELQHIEGDWLEDYFPQKNAKKEKVDISKFRPRSSKSDRNTLLDE